ncbi:unnamed protein product [Cuscuta europaea]|nr:unnamed protein product [Cuscuta europaea]
MKATVMIRRLKKDVLPQLPVKRRQQVFLNVEEKEMKCINALFREADCKFLIFAHHLQMIDSIHQYLLKKKVGCIRIDSSTPASSRQALVTDFQEKESIKAAVLSIKAGGV